MRALLASNEITASPGQPFSLGLEVSNTEEVIDSVSVSVSGLPGASVKTVPGELPLFPGASGTTVVTVELPVGFPAGRYDAKVEARATRFGRRDRLLRLRPRRRTGQQGITFGFPFDQEGPTEIAVFANGREPGEHSTRSSAGRFRS